MRGKIVKIAGWTISLFIIILAGAWLTFVPFAKEPGYEFVSAWGAKGGGPAQFDDPTGIAIAAGQVFVSDARNERIQVFDLEGNFLRAFGKPGKEAGELGRPMNLASKDGELFVSEYFNDRIQVFSLEGTPLRIIGKAGSGPGEFSAPGGVAIGADGAIYVADFYNHRIQKLSRDGTFIRQWGNSNVQGAGPRTSTDPSTDTVSASFSYPTDVALSATGALYVADSYNDRIQAFKPNGVFSHRWGGPFAANIHGPFNGWFATVTSIAIGPQGNVFVADFYNHRIQKFTSDGIFLSSLGRRGISVGEFNYPIAVAVADDGTVFVVDYGNNRIQKWRQ